MQEEAETGAKVRRRMAVAARADFKATRGPGQWMYLQRLQIDKHVMALLEAVHVGVRVSAPA